jgi:hypothetical protein
MMKYQALIGTLLALFAAICSFAKMQNTKKQEGKN